MSSQDDNSDQAIANRSLQEKIVTALVAVHGPARGTQIIVDALAAGILHEANTALLEVPRPYVAARLVIYEFTSQDALDKQLGRSQCPGVKQLVHGNQIRVVEIPPDWLSRVKSFLQELIPYGPGGDPMNYVEDAEKLLEPLK